MCEVWEELCGRRADEWWDDYREAGSLCNEAVRRLQVIGRNRRRAAAREVTLDPAAIERNGDAGLDPETIAVSRSQLSDLALTAQERRIVELRLEGRTWGQVAKDSGLSLATVKRRRKSIEQKAEEAKKAADSESDLS